MRERPYQQHLIDSSWKCFNIPASNNLPLQQEVIEWCEQLDGNQGLFSYRVWSVSGMHVLIERPDHAFAFKLRWC